MNLWIRSQNRESLTKISNIQYTYHNELHIIATYYDNLKVLAKYKTKERALEVLDEIQTILRRKYATSFDYKTSLKGFKPEDIEHLLELMAVYEMPEE